MVYMKTTTNQFNTGDAEVIERERKANSVRKKSLNELEYVSIPYESLPFMEDTDETPLDEVLRSDQEAIRSFEDKKMVNFTGISNTDLKETYGVANLTVLSEYDQNFTALVQALDAWGEHLLLLDMKNEARTVLEFAVSIQSDLKSSYSNLATIYAENFEFEKIDHLGVMAENLNSLMKRPIIRELKRISDLSNYIETKEATT